MAVPDTTEAFLNLVKQSGLVELPRLQEYVKERLSSGGIPASARRIAQEMLSDGLLTKFQAEQVLMGHYRKFEVTGKYRLLERIGEGGAAAVYLCEHLVLKRPVALKILPSWKTKSPEIVARFLREARAAAMVDHPNIVRVHDVEAADQNYFLVTEFVDGPNLEVLVEATGPLAPARAARYIHEAALALQHAHEVGLVHRDVKPSNLLVDQAGHVKLLDLGLVKLTQMDDGLTQSLDGKAVLGTIDFQAPEQAVDSSDVDIRADIYSLGASFFFLLTGQVVFPEGTVAQKLSWHQQRTPPALRDLRPEVPERIARIVARMLAKDPRDRFQEPGQIADALGPWAQGPPQPLEEFELPRTSRAARTFLANWAARGSQRLTPIPALARRPTPPRIPLLDRPTPPRFGRTRPTRRTLAIAALGTVPILASIAFATWPARHPYRSTGTDVRKQAIEPVPISDPVPRILASTRVPLLEELVTGDVPGPNDPAATVSIRLVSANRPVRPSGTIQAAIDQAEPGDRIEVQGTRLRESVNWLHRPGVTLASANPNREPIVWEPAGIVGEERCCLRIQGSEDATIQGFQMLGDDRAPTLIRVVGACPGLLLEDLEFQGSLRPLALRATCGSIDRPEVLHRLRFDRPGGSAIVLESGSDDPDQPIGSVRVDLCRFEGPSPSAIRVEAPTEAVEIRRCRFFRLDDGVLLADEAERAPVDLAIVGNTFHQVRRGLRFELTPHPGCNLIVRNNLFVKTDVLAQIDGLANQPDGFGAPLGWPWDRTTWDSISVVSEPVCSVIQIETDGNVRDEISGEGVPNLSTTRTVVRDRSLPTSPTDDSRFLRYSRRHPLFRAGVEGQPVGLPQP